MKYANIITAFALGSLIFFALFFYERDENYKEITIESGAPTHKILLLPLDSRPQCLDFAVYLGKIANLEIIAPPKSLLGDDRDFARPYKIRAWLKENIALADAAIISTDMLMHGGLLPSRLNAGGASDINAAIALLTEIHEKFPDVPLYAFNVIPRLAVADKPDAAKWRDELLEYSALTEKVCTFGERGDTARLDELRRKIPAALLADYHKLFNDNAAINARLLELTKKNILTKLVIGQDDGETFGLSNITRAIFYNDRRRFALDENKAVLTRGADEIAQTLLCCVYQYLHGFSVPKIFVRYNTEEAARTIMPYMPNPTEISIAEKIYLSGAAFAETEDDADFILYVNIGTETSDRYKSALEVKKLLADSKKIALIDLSENFSKDETLLPLLLSGGAPVNRLIAYAGWNTTSNSAGTALAQAILFTEQAKNLAHTDLMLSLYKNNLTFLNARFLEDYFYLKQDIDSVNKLLAAESIDSYRLDSDMDFAETALQKISVQSLNSLKSATSWQKPISVITPQGEINLILSDISAKYAFPWHRSFEIALKLDLFFKTSGNFTNYY